jgi:hypothetical protein
MVAVAYDRIEERNQDDHTALDQKKRLDAKAEAVSGHADQQRYRKGKGHEQPDVIEDSD